MFRVFSLLAPLLAVQLCFADEPLRIGILDFADKGGSRESAWISRGLPDLVLRKLLPESSLQFVEREKLREIQEELSLKDSGFASTTTLTSPIDCDYLLSGTFKSKDKVIDVHYILLPVKMSGKTRAFDCRINGSMEDLDAISSRIAEQIGRLSKRLPINCSSSGKPASEKHDLDELEANAHFYRALQLYEQGRYPDAHAEMELSRKSAPGKEEAVLWSVKIDEELGEYEHAAIRIEEALKGDLSKRYRFHLSLMLSNIFRRHLNLPEKAREALLPIENMPGELYERAILLLALSEAELDAYLSSAAFERLKLLYREVYDYRNSSSERSQNALSPELRISYPSIQAPTLYEIQERSLKGYRSAYLRSILKDKLSIPEPEGVTILTGELSDAVKPGTGLPHLQGTITGEVLLDKEDRSLNRLVIAPAGFYFGQIKLTFHSGLGDTSGGIHAYQEELSPGFLSTAFHCYLRTRSTVELAAELAQCDLSLFKVRSFIVDSKGTAPAKWTVDYELIPEDRKKGFIWKTRYEGLLSEHLIFPKLIPILSEQASHLALLIRKEGSPLIVYDSYASMESQTVDRSDLFAVSGDSSFEFSPSVRLDRLSSPVADIYPTLLGDERNDPFLFFSSNRSGKYHVWLSSSREGVRWNSPLRLAIPPPQNIDPQTVEFYSLASLYDVTGLFHLLLFEKNTGQFYLSHSEDLQTWSIPVSVGKRIAASGYPTGDLFQDATGVFHAVLSPPHWSDTRMQLGMSLDGIRWEFREASFPGTDSPRMTQLTAGELVLVFGGGVSGKGLTQVRSKDGRIWESPVVFPNAELCGSLSSTYYASADLKRLSSGKTLLISRGYNSSVIGAYLLDSMPVTDVFQAWKLSDTVPRHLRLHLNRDEIYGTYWKSRGNK